MKNVLCRWKMNFKLIVLCNVQVHAYKLTYLLSAYTVYYLKKLTRGWEDCAEDEVRAICHCRVAVSSLWQWISSWQLSDIIEKCSKNNILLKKFWLMLPKTDLTWCHSHPNSHWKNKSNDSKLAIFLLRKGQDALLPVWNKRANV